MSLRVLLFSLCIAAVSAIETSAASSGTDTLCLYAELNSSISTDNSLRPMWSYSQNWGRFTQYNQGEVSLYAKGIYEWQNQSKWLKIKAGAGLQASSDRNLSMIHEAYVSGNISDIDFTVGKQAFTPIEQRGDGLGLGTYIMSDNARPSPRVGAGFFDWRSFPCTDNWLEVKGGLFVGMLENEDNVTYTRNVITQEKFAYLRMGRFAIKPYLGMLHSVYMGGTMQNGTEIPIDFIASFFGKGSEKMKNAGLIGEYYNAAGGHQGMWDLGLDFDFEKIEGSLYYQRPIYDVTALNLFRFSYCRDFTLGTEVRIKSSGPIESLCFEYFTTMWQGGNGIADPVFTSTGPEKTGETISLAQSELTPELLRLYLGAEVQDWEASTGHPLSQDECCDFLVKYTMPQGWTWGNRTPYLQNYCYPQGWTAGGLSSGCPIMLSNTTMNAIAPEYTFYNRFPNVRLWALNFGLSGSIVSDLDWKFKLTFTENHGCYQEEYYTGVDFYKKRPDYYFTENGLKEFYTGLWLGYRLGRFSFNVAFCYDFGEMYRSFSGRFGIRFSI